MQTLWAEASPCKDQLSVLELSNQILAVSWEMWCCLRDKGRGCPLANGAPMMNTRTALILLAIGLAYFADPMPSFAQRASNNANVGGLNGGGGVGGVNGVSPGASSSLGGLNGGGGSGGVNGVGGYRGGVGAISGVSTTATGVGEPGVAGAGVGGGSTGVGGGR
jgi:hypothetical protein